MEVAETNSNGVDAGHYPGWHQSVSPQALGQPELPDMWWGLEGYRKFHPKHFLNPAIDCGYGYVRFLFYIAYL